MRTGLILVDIQNDYFSGGKMALAGMDAAGENARRLLDFFRDKKWPTVHVQHVAAHKGATFFVPDTEGVKLNPCIEPLQGETVVAKAFPNGFRETALNGVLQAAGIEKVVICGAMSHMCIDATTRAAADLGYRCVLVHDACATRDLEFKARKVAAQDVHAAFMAALGAAYAEVLGCAEFLQQND